MAHRRGGRHLKTAQFVGQVCNSSVFLKKNPTDAFPIQRQQAKMLCPLKPACKLVLFIPAPCCQLEGKTGSWSHLQEGPDKRESWLSRPHPLTLLLLFKVLLDSALQEGPLKKSQLFLGSVLTQSYPPVAFSITHRRL